MQTTRRKFLAGLGAVTVLATAPFVGFDITGLPRLYADGEHEAEDAAAMAAFIQGKPIVWDDSVLCRDTSCRRAGKSFRDETEILGVDLVEAAGPDGAEIAYGA